MRAAAIVLATACVLGTACSSSAKSADSTPTTTTTSSATTTTVAQTKRKSVFVLSVDPAKRTVIVDPMKFLTGPAATAAYHRAHPQARPGGPPDDYYIVNATKDHVVMNLAPDVKVRVVQSGGTVHTTPVPVPLATLASYPALSKHPFWITVNGGKVTRVDEQFVP